MLSDKRSNLADKRAGVTREAIIAATQELLITDHPATISVPAVARTAGVSVRTVYRHFPNKAALLDAVANHFPDQVIGSVSRNFTDISQARDDLMQLWLRFGDNMPAVRAEHLSPAGAELRQRRLTDTRLGVAKAVVAALPDACDDDREKLTDLIVAATSSSMFLELTDRLGRTPAEAARLAMWTVNAFIKTLAEEGPMP